MTEKRRRRKRHDFLVLKLVLLVAVVLVIFEGRLVMTMISNSSLQKAPNVTQGSTSTKSAAGLDGDPTAVIDS